MKEESDKTTTDIIGTITRRFAQMGFRPLPSELSGDTIVYTPNGQDWTEIDGRNLRRGRIRIKSVSVTHAAANGEDQKPTVTVTTDGAYFPFHCSKSRLPWDGSFPADNVETLEKEVFAKLHDAIRGAQVAIVP